MTEREEAEFEAVLDVGRTVAFSDAVIAIALTLLAIELPVPKGDTSAEVWHDFANDLNGDYLAFLISFVVIAAFWLVHHRFFQYIARMSLWLALWNLMGLLAIVLVPFATKLLGSPEGFTGNYSLGPVVYASTMLLWGTGYVAMALTAQRGRLWREGTPAAVAGRMVFGAVSALSMFVISIPIAFINSDAAQYSWLLIPIVATLAGVIRGRLTDAG